MPEFRSLKALEKYIKDRMSDSLQGEVINTVKQIMQNNILREVYLRYRPKRYERRGNSGGLMDDKNIVHKMATRNKVEIFNIAKRNTNYANTSYANPYLAPVIEFGHEEAISKGYQGYNFPYPSYAYYYPRPFIKRTREDLRKNKQHVKAIQRNLRAFGIDSELKGR